MTTLTLRRIKDHFVVTGSDVEPTRFESRREVRTGAVGIIRAHEAEESDCDLAGWAHGNLLLTLRPPRRAPRSVRLQPLPFKPPSDLFKIGDPFDRGHRAVARDEKGPRNL